MGPNNLDVLPTRSKQNAPSLAMVRLLRKALASLEESKPEEASTSADPRPGSCEWVEVSNGVCFRVRSPVGGKG